MVVVSESEQEHYEKITSGSDGKKQLSYIFDTTEEWEKIETIEGVNNRLVIWPGNVFHSIEVKVDPSLGRVNEKRLTQRVIINEVAAK
jgi:hypothetical protein